MLISAWYELQVRGQAIVTCCDRLTPHVLPSRRWYKFHDGRMVLLAFFLPRQRSIHSVLQLFLGKILLLRSFLYMCMWSPSDLLRVKFLATLRQDDRETFVRSVYLFFIHFSVAKRFSEYMERFKLPPINDPNSISRFSDAIMVIIPYVGSRSLS